MLRPELLEETGSERFSDLPEVTVTRSLVAGLQSQTLHQGLMDSKLCKVAQKLGARTVETDLLVVWPGATP